MPGRVGGFDNPPNALVGSAEACRLLGVKPATLYAYVSREKLRVIRTPGRKARQYLLADVERLLSRSEARRGHAAVATAALRWGEPVLDSTITYAGPEGLFYRGVSTRELAKHSTLEGVADLLWQAEGTTFEASPAPSSRVSRWVQRFVRLLPRLATRDATRGWLSPKAELARAAGLVGQFAEAMAGAPLRGKGALVPRLGRALGLTAAHVDVLGAALVLCADHELNASTFTARIAASAGADLYACVGAALYTVTGVRHGASCDRLEAMMTGLPRTHLGAVVRKRVERGEGLPGFGHPLYPEGDPRAQQVFEMLTEAGIADPRTRDWVRAVGDALGEAPLIDLALVAFARSANLPPGAATGLFAFARVLGWVAHVMEQRAQGALLRPRARYVGPPLKT